MHMHAPRKEPGPARRDPCPLPAGRQGGDFRAAISNPVCLKKITKQIRTCPQESTCADLVTHRRSLGSAGPSRGGLSDAGRPAAGASLARLGMGRSLWEGDPRSSAMRRPSLVSSGGPGTTKGCWVSSLVRSDLRGGRLMFAGRLCWARGHHRLPPASLQGIVSLSLRRKKQGLGEVAQVPAPQLTSHWRDWRWSSDPSRRLRPELRPCLA